MSVYKAINAVQAELAKTGILKNRRNTQGAGYQFRGIDDVYNAIAPLLAQHGLCILPRIVARQCEERQTKAGGAIFYVTVEAEFDLVCAEDGSKHTVRTFGEAMDTSDKATNKAMSAAYKYAAFQTFAIPTEADNDADAHTHELKARAPKHSAVKNDPAVENATPEEREALNDIAMEAMGMVKDGKPTSAREFVKAQNLDNDQKTLLWSLLDAPTRSALKTAEKAPQIETA
jgi:hypothetical protein